MKKKWSCIKMLHHSQEFECHKRVTFWRSNHGAEAFYRTLVVRLESQGHDAPPREDPEIELALRTAIPSTATAMQDEEVDGHISDALTMLVERVVHQRRRTQRHKDWVSQPQSMRLMERSQPDRERVQHRLDNPNNPHFRRWLELHESTLAK